MIIYQIDVKYACFGIVEENGIIVEAAPIAKWTMGKEIDFVLQYYKSKKKAKIKLWAPSRASRSSEGTAR